MTAPSSRDYRKGNPLLMMGLLLLGWVVIRVFSWTPPAFDIRFPDKTLLIAHYASGKRGRHSAFLSSAPLSASTKATHGADPAGGTDAGNNYSPALAKPDGHNDGKGPTGSKVGYTHINIVEYDHQHTRLVQPACFSVSQGLPRRQGIADRPDCISGEAPVLTVAQEGTRQRWSADGWLYLRQGANRAPSSAPSQPAYGYSQAGAVMRYYIDPSSQNRPALFIRATLAPGRQSQTDIAAGLAARPLRSVPLTANAELRVTRIGENTELRPAIFVNSEFAALSLSDNIRVEAFGQAGFVGGDYESAFVDGQIRFTRKISNLQDIPLHVGVGAWGGAQKGASRLDAGPTATLDMKLGDIPARLSVDYRIKLAGDAEPGHGAGMTLSTGF